MFNEQLASDIIQAAKSHKNFDKSNIKEIAKYHGLTEEYVKNKINDVRLTIAKRGKQ